MARQVIIFAKTPRPGRVKTRLQPAYRPEVSLRLHRAFVTDTLRLAGQTTAEKVCIAFSEEPDESLLIEGVEVWRQVGSDLGERLRHASAQAFGSGARKIVFLGTDSPDVPSAFIDHAFEALEGADVVIGPSADGGYYLIGLSGRHPGIFEGIPWSTEQVAARTRERARFLDLKIREISPWFDVDRPEDVDRLAREIHRRRSCGEPFPAETCRVLQSLGLVAG